ncbi:permease-like cell division protein FtsX [Hymenobacter sp. DH14]|uniref:Cell division protein FtsX n=1 Tax=Hymenobacter cyanobacteriorum TaxID=2926463 RepID=A0A9X2AHN5_9BACT|nr:permease-like cell division protein FtsX [Hymenobacter cyanobacteriorum]MCI1189083.1 permease-like cell division protein FtsX [Hymenobacter cyanobacteriorum]
MAAPSTPHTRKKKLGSYPTLLVVFSITLALVVIGLFGLLLVHAQKLSEVVRENLEVQVYLDRDLPETELLRLQQDLGQQAFVAERNGKPQIRFVSKEEGARQLLQSTGEDFRQFLGDNPLRDAYVLKIKPEFTDTMHLRQLNRSISTQRGVFEVQYPQDLFASINNNLTRVSLVLLGFAAVLVLVVVILINNTIKLALFSQRFLIRSMQLVGATRLFIQQPFLRRATWQGLASGVLAALILIALLQYAYLEVEPLRLLRDDLRLGLLLLGVVVLGVVIGFFSSARAVHKYLQMSLDDLY